MVIVGLACNGQVHTELVLVHVIHTELWHMELVHTGLVHTELVRFGMMSNKLDYAVQVDANSIDFAECTHHA